jgi:PHD/YefM family antitoxin component YafN of YafNO toxin-antitoxin module
VEIEGETYYVLQAEADEDRVLILRREGESLVTLDEEEHDRVVEQLEEFEEDDEVDDDGGPQH